MSFGNADFTLALTDMRDAVQDNYETIERIVGQLERGEVMMPQDEAIQLGYVLACRVSQALIMTMRAALMPQLEVPGDWTDRLVQTTHQALNIDSKLSGAAALRQSLAPLKRLGGLLDELSAYWAAMVLSSGTPLATDADFAALLEG